MKKQVPLTPVLALALVIIAAGGWFGLVGPKQSRAGALAEEIADLEQRLALAERPRDEADEPAVEIDVADVFRLAKAMPDREDMPGMILELNSIALSTGVEFVAMQPSTPVARASYHSVPVTLTFEGNYYDLTDFLFRLRNLVSVRDGVLAASGRMYTLDAIELQEGTEGFPNITAVLTVSAYAYGAPPAAPGAAPPPSGTTTGETTTTTTDTTATTTTTTTTDAPPADPSGDGDVDASGGSG